MKIAKRSLKMTNINDAIDGNEEPEENLTPGQKAVADVIVEMCQGNPGALTAIMEMIKADFAGSAMATGMMKAYGIVGEYIWIAYKDICGEDAQKLVDLVKKDYGRSLADQLAALPYCDYKAPSRLAGV
jgi:hypothetical protein